MTRRRWWIVGLSAWGLLLLVLAVVTQGEPTVREQQTAAAARPVVDRVLAAAVTLAGDDVAVAVGPYQRIGSCRMTAARSGVQYRRSAEVYGRPGDTQRLLDRYLSGLPHDYGARRLIGPDGTIIGADPPGTLVKLSVKPVGADADGHVQIVVNTGCRPASQHPHAEFLAAPSDTERAVPQSLAAALGVAPSSWRRTVLTCPGGRYTTVTAQGSGDGVSLDELLHPDSRQDPMDPSGDPAQVLNQSATRLVERQDGTGLVVQLTAGRLRVDATTPCR